MRHRSRALVALITLAAGLSACGQRQPPPAPAGAAPNLRAGAETPERGGVRSSPLADMIAYVRENDVAVHHVTVLRGGRTILDVDFFPYSSDVMHDIASVTKSITSLLVGITIDEGSIESVDAPVRAFFPDIEPRDPSPRLEHLTLRHLLTMTTGFCSDFAGGEAQLDAMRQADDAVRFMLNEPLLHEPGEHFAYCSGGTQLLSAVLTEATGMNAEAYAEAHLFGPLGIESVIWPADPHGNSNGWGDFFIRPADLAKIGQLVLQRGVWNGERLISERWIAEATTQQVADGDEGYGFLWWIPNSLPGLYEGRGRGGQRLSVWPQEDLVVVMLGSGFDPGALGAFIVEALAPGGPLPPDPEGYARLREHIARAQSPPPPGPTAPLPETARRISGHRYVFGPNEVGLAAFRLDFDASNAATFTLTLDNPRALEFGDRVTAVGLDGRYRITPSSRFGLPIAARGHWEDEHTFHFEYDEFANNHLYDMTLRFRGDRAALTIREGTGLIDETVNATRRAP